MLFTCRACLRRTDFEDIRHRLSHSPSIIPFIYPIPKQYCFLQKRKLFQNLSFIRGKTNFFRTASDSSANSFQSHCTSCAVRIIRHTFDSPAPIGIKAAAFFPVCRGFFRNAAHKFRTARQIGCQTPNRLLTAAQ